MRILVMTDLFPPVAFGGYERECATVVEHLRQEHEVLVLTSDRRRAELPPEDGVLRVLPALGEGHRAVEVARGPLAAARAARVARATLDEFRPDLVYAWEMTMVPHAAMVVAAERGLPMAYRFCTEFMGELYAGDRFLRELRPTGVRGPRAAWGRTMRALNAAPGLRLQPARHRASVAWASEALRRQAGLSDDIDAAIERIIWPATAQNDRLAGVERDPAPEPTILYVGRVVEEKGIDLPIRALRTMRDERGIDARLVVAGPEDAAERARLDRLARELDVADRIAWRGMLEFDALSREFTAAHVVVLPSRCVEALPLAACEAAFARVPFVGAEIGGIPEALVPGEHALFFAPDDAAGCADALATVLERPAEAAARAERAYARAEERFALGRYLAETDRFLAETHAALAGAAA